MSKVVRLSDYRKRQLILEQISRAIEPMVIEMIRTRMLYGPDRCGYYGCILKYGHDGLHDTGS